METTTTPSAHTPGPWLAMPQIPDFDTEPTVGICTKDNVVIAMVYPDGHPEAVEPNARLIVAACNAAMNANPDNPIAAAEALPDLLKACKAAEVDLGAIRCAADRDEPFTSKQLIELFDVAVHLCRVAIAKAEGR